MKKSALYFLIPLSGLLIVAIWVGTFQGFAPRPVGPSADRPGPAALPLHRTKEANHSETRKDPHSSKTSSNFSSTRRARDLFLGLPEEDLAGAAAREMFDQWATNQPSEAINWALAHSEKPWGRALLDLAVIRWAGSNPADALAWALKLPDGEFREVSLAGVGHEAVRTDPHLAITAASQIADRSVQDELVCRALGEWAASDPDGALSWAASLEEAEFRQLAVASAAVASSERDPVGAATLILKNMSPGADRDRAITSVVLNWVQKDPIAAASWVSGFPDNKLRQDAVDAMVNLWAHKNPSEAGRWLAELPQGDFRDLASASYRRILEQTDQD